MAHNISFGRRTVVLIPDGSRACNLVAAQARAFPLNTITGDFTVGEAVSQATSGATGVVQDWENNILYLSNVVGTFDITHVVTGASSTAHGIPSYVGPAFPNGIRLSAVRFTPSAAGDRLIVRGSGIATGPILMDLLANTAADIARAVGGRSLREKPYILESECVFDNPAKAVVVFEYD